MKLQFYDNMQFVTLPNLIKSLNILKAMNLVLCMIGKILEKLLVTFNKKTIVISFIL